MDRLTQRGLAWAVAWLVCYVAVARAEDVAKSQGSRDKSHGPEGRSNRAPAQDSAVRAAIEKVLRSQQDAWNRGDVRAFIDHYWTSSDLTFSSSGKTTRGWQATLDRYRERYPTREKMGRLTLSGLEITPLGDATALVLGQWKLESQSEPVQGNFTLVLRKIGSRWVIVHDHTSRLVE